MTALDLPGSPVTLWVPPAGMDTAHARGWRTFYRHIWSVYQVEPKEYRAIYLAQLGRCYICQKARGMHPDSLKPSNARRLGVDHNHALGNRKEAVRGLLCNWGDKSCNRTIGYLSYEALGRAQVYLAESPAQSVIAAVQAGLPDEQIQGMVLHP